MTGREGRLRLLLVRLLVVGLCGAILAAAQGHWSSAFSAQIRHPTGQTRFLRLGPGFPSPGLRHLSQPGLATGAEGSAAQPAAAAEEKDITESLAVQGGLFAMYFIVQSGMTFYMKWILSKVQVASDLVGVPASFLVTASQQLVAFGLFIVFMLGSRLIGKPYRPKILASRTELLLVLGLSVSFSLNIGLNLLSLSLVPLSLTMIIRACSPLSTAAVQSVMMKKKQDISAAEWCCLSVGVFCACAVVVAQSGGPSGKASFAFFFGVAMSVASLFSAGLDFVFKGVLGTNVKLNALDTTCYMALPVAFFTSIFGAILCKPVSSSWAARFAPRMTDFAVFQKLWEVNPGVLGWVLVSGLLAFVYNIFVTFLCVKLSPATAAFAGNFNKSATILLSLLVLEGTMLKGGPRGLVIVGAVLGNIVAFTLYNVLKKRRQMQK